jgi:hypothetical protein
MKYEKEFKGYATVDGDDGYCFGVHATFSEVKGKNGGDFSTEMIDWLDGIFDQNLSKKIKVSISIDVEEE